MKVKTHHRTNFEFILFIKREEKPNLPSYSWAYCGKPAARSQSHASFASISEKHKKRKCIESQATHWPLPPQSVGTGGHCSGYYKAKLFSGKSVQVAYSEMGVKWAGITKVLVSCLLRLSSMSIHKYLDNSKTTDYRTQRLSLRQGKMSYLYAREPGD